MDKMQMIADLTAAAALIQKNIDILVKSMEIEGKELLTQKQSAYSYDLFSLKERGIVDLLKISNPTKIDYSKEDVIGALKAIKNDLAKHFSVAMKDNQHHLVKFASDCMKENNELVNKILCILTKPKTIPKPLSLIDTDFECEEDIDE